MSFFQEQRSFKIDSKLSLILTVFLNLALKSGRLIGGLASRDIELPFKLGDSGSILGRTFAQDLKIIEEKVLPLH